MQKIIERIIEPSKVYAGSIFRLKIKAIRYLTYEEIKDMTVSDLKQYTVAELKGEG